MNGLHVVKTLDGRYRRYRVQDGDRLVACYNPADDTTASFLLRRPSLHPVYTPRGLPVTEQGAHNYPHHKGVFLALGKVNDTNVYSDLTHSTGRLTTTAVRVTDDGESVVLDATIDWLDESEAQLVEERRTHRFYPPAHGGRANRVDVVSELRTLLPDGVALNQDKHGYFHARVIDAIDEEDGGTVTASNGMTGTETLFGTDGYWIDTRGTIGPNAVGLTIMAHPSGGPQPLFTREYGTVALNPFAREGRHLDAGAVYRTVYSVWAYDDPDGFDVTRAYDEFAATDFDEVGTT